MSQRITAAEYRALTQGKPQRKRSKGKPRIRALPSRLPMGAVYELQGDDGHTHGFVMAELGGFCGCGCWISRVMIGELEQEG